jgi:hypothetical protein
MKFSGVVREEKRNLGKFKTYNSQANRQGLTIMTEQFLKEVNKN